MAIFTLSSTIWTFVLAAPANALAHPVVKPQRINHIKPYKNHDQPAWHTINYYQHDTVIPDEPVNPKIAALYKDWPGELIDPIGQFVHSMPMGETNLWKLRLHKEKLPVLEQARLHLLLGEAEIGKEWPEMARWQLRDVENLTGKKSPFYGRAAFDLAVAQYRAGAYIDSAKRFMALITSTPALLGYDKRNAIMMYRHADTCASYHLSHEKLGIPEPTALDPLCAAAAMAVCLRAMDKRYSKWYVSAAVHHTGEGSDLQNIVNGAKRLGLDAQPMAISTDSALMRIPMPCIGFVEHDHFIALTKADKQGVTYICSDCGPWPGGQVHLNWNQWHALDASAYITITKPASIAEAEAYALIGKTDPYLKNNLLLRKLVDTECQGVYGGGNLGNNQTTTKCGFTPAAPHCTKDTNCAEDGCPGNKNGKGPKQPPTAAKTTSIAPSSSGPSMHDPVNLSTGEEEYGPEQDLEVYNPIGPAVNWDRMYDSLRGDDPTYEYDDYGSGWTQNYNMGIYDPTPQSNTLLNQGETETVALPGTNSPASGLTWDILLNGTSIATSSSPNGWQVGSSTVSATVKVPTTATIADNYELRAISSSGPQPGLSTNVTIGGGGGSGSPESGYFDVLPPFTAAQASNVTLPLTGSDLPANGANWDITYNSSVIASSNHPLGWFISATVEGSTNAVIITTPDGAVLGGGYEARINNGQGTGSVDFNVQGPHLQPGVGTKYIFFPNGSRIRFTVSAIPTASTPVVNAVVENGHAYLVQWCYDSRSAFGHYIITDSSRTKWVTTGAIDENGAGYVCYSLAQQIDSSGNYINFLYSGVGPSGFPLMSSITDSTNQPLLTITRATDGTGNITAISDRYGRSVYYHESTYATQNVPIPWNQSAQELDHVSQIVTTNSPSPANREVYGFALFSNGEGSELVPYLHTITVPSPTGTGTATATINYSSIGTVSSIVDANGNTRSYSAVNGNESQVTVTNAQGTVVYKYEVGFDNNMSETSITNGSGTTYSESVYASANDPLRPSETVDGNGVASGNSKGVTTTTWDTYGNAISVTSPYGTITSFSYSYNNFALGELTSMQEGAKTPSTFTYFEPSGLIASITSAKPGTTSGPTVTMSFTYDALGNLVTETMPGNNASATITKTFNYTQDGSYSQNEGLHEPIAVTDNLGHTNHFRYDALSNKIAEIDALGNETDMTYNIANQLSTITFAAANMDGTGRWQVVDSYLFPTGPMMAMTQYNESGNAIYQHLFTYGPEGEPLTRTGSTQPVSETYDACYRLVSLTDGNGNTTHYTYNSAGYLASYSYPMGQTYQFTSYDDDGNLLQRTDGRGVVTNYVYNDPESQITDIQYPATPAINVHYSYDMYGRRTGVTDGTGSRSTIYDDTNTPTDETTTYTGLPAETISYSYNPDGSRSGMVLPNGGNFTYNYDGAQRLVDLTNPSGQSWAWTYLANDWLIQQNDNNQVLENVTRDARGFVTALNNVLDNGQNTILSSYGIGYDSQGEIGAVTSNVPGVASLTGTTDFNYDYQTELTSEQSTRMGTYSYNNAYDAAGNPTTFKNAANTFNANNQNTVEGYDANGNPTQYFGAAVSWDAENRMPSFGTVLTAGYMSDGMRAWKQNANGKTYFLYDGSQPVMELSSSGNTLATNTFGPSGPLARTSNGRTLLYTTDVQGNLSQQINAATGAVVASYGFDAWGHRSVVTHDPTASSDPYSGFGGMVGYYTDWETGLELCGLRYYDSGTGRWLNRDPISYAGGVNLYEYCDNSILDRHDSSGMFDFSWLPGAGLWSGLTCALNTGLDLIGNSVGGSNSICAMLTQCGCAILASILTGMIDTWTGGLSIVMTGCISGAIASACSELTGYLCDHYVDCTADPESPGCRIAGMIAGIIGGCIAGMLGSGYGEEIDEWISNMLGLEFGLGDSSGTDAGCQYFSS